MTILWAKTAPVTRALHGPGRRRSGGRHQELGQAVGGPPERRHARRADAHAVMAEHGAVVDPVQGDDLS